MSVLPFKTVVEHLAQYSYEKYEYLSWGSRAAVLVPLFSDSNERANVLMTVRSTQLKRHSGEVALPGGKCENDEVEIETALREAHEEIGTTAKDVRIVNILEPLLSKFKNIVRPVVGVIDPSFSPKLDPKEVSTVFSVPLDIFLSKSHHHSVDWKFEQYPWRIHHFTYDGHTIWGLTALILIHIARIGFRRDAEFDLNLPGSMDHLQLTKHLLSSKSHL
jgi:peroxisomal coenzyme A diphosphatase NUDT7